MPGDLNEAEQAALDAYLELLPVRLGRALAEAWLFGSAARGDMWADWMPIHSDVDLLVVTREELPAALREELIDATYPLFLDSGRQIAPQFRTLHWWSAPPSERDRDFVARVRAEGRRLLP